MTAESEDPLYRLLQRAVDDDGPEGTVAREMFRKRARGRKGQVYFLEEDYKNPMLWVVKRQDEKIAKQDAEVKRLRDVLSKRAAKIKRQAEFMVEEA